MNSRLATSIGRNRDVNEYAIEVATLQRDQARARVHRLLATAFEDEGKALLAVDRLLRQGGYDRVIDALTGDFQQRHFGFQRKAFLGFFASRSPDVRRALAELLDALRELHVAQDFVNDLKQAARAQSAARTPEHDERRTQEHARDRTRNRTR